MKKVSLLILASLACLSLSAQQTELDKRNGFKDIQVNSPIDSVHGATYKKEVNEKGLPALGLYDVDNPAYESIGDVEVKKLEVFTYDSLVYKIHVITEKDPRLMKALQSTLGNPTYNIVNKTWEWGGQNLTLTFGSYSKNKLELWYRSLRVEDRMKRDKARKVENIADDL